MLALGLICTPFFFQLHEIETYIIDYRFFFFKCMPSMYFPLGTVLLHPTKVKTDQMFVNRWKDRQKAFYPNNEILFGHKNKWHIYMLQHGCPLQKIMLNECSHSQHHVVYNSVHLRAQTKSYIETDSSLGVPKARDWQRKMGMLGVIAKCRGVCLREDKCWKIDCGDDCTHLGIY